MYSPHIEIADRARYIRGSLEVRFLAKIKKNGNGQGCWIWTASRDDFGYGRINVGNKPQVAHRVSWRLFNGDIPPGMHVLHTCDVAACVRPDHLHLGTNDDNVRERKERGRDPLCGGKGERQHLSKFTDEQVRALRLAYRQGASIRSLAIITLSDWHTVENAVTGKTWKHIGGSMPLREDRY